MTSKLVVHDIYGKEVVFENTMVDNGRHYTLGVNYHYDQPSVCDYDDDVYDEIIEWLAEQSPQDDSE